MLLWSVNNIGKKWTQISWLFPKRTDVLIKSQYKKLIRRNATLENVFQISSDKMSKEVKEEEQPTSICDEFLFNDDLFTAFGFEYEL